MEETSTQHSEDEDTIPYSGPGEPLEYSGTVLWHVDVDEERRWGEMHTRQMFVPAFSPSLLSTCSTAA
ncbi:Hypp2943 [Branchiostoma lanceolatum]|uniref:Hypp2943 protein n=1 Tax=Branchiostoma lanceolatum TaxID=7740 RepID=A0A8J9ZVF3_BRALA|nr:Hypp2943 [Branchiostoma lanceolatum]